MKSLIIIILSISCLLGLVGCQANDLNEPMYVPNLYPNANNTGSIGSPSQYWANGYFTNINGLPYPSVVNPVLTDINEKVATYPLLPLSASCVLEGYKSISSNFIDVSGHSNHGTITNASWVQLPSGLWVNTFNGAGYYIACPNAFGDVSMVNQPVSILAWVNPTALNSFYMLGSCIPTTSTKYGMIVFKDSGNHVMVDFMTLGGAGSTHFDYTYTMQAATWILVGITYDGNGTPSSTTVKSYVNGSPDAYLGGGAAAGWAFSNAIMIGTGQDQTYNWVGGIGLFRVFNRVLSATEISDIYNNEKGLFP